MEKLKVTLPFTEEELEIIREYPKGLHSFNFNDNPQKRRILKIARDFALKMYCPNKRLQDKYLFCEYYRKMFGIRSNGNGMEFKKNGGIQQDKTPYNEDFQETLKRVFEGLGKETIYTDQS